MNWIGRTSPDDVTVERSSGLVVTVTTVTSGVSFLVAKIVMITISNKRTPKDEPIIIFDLRLNAIS
jgi:hypothetical protein